MTRETLITSSQLPRRLRNACKKFYARELQTVNDLLSLTGKQVSCMRGVGPYTLRETKEILAQHGFALQAEH